MFVHVANGSVARREKICILDFSPHSFSYAQTSRATPVPSVLDRDSNQTLIQHSYLAVQLVPIHHSHSTLFANFLRRLVTNASLSSVLETS